MGRRHRARDDYFRTVVGRTRFPLTDAYAGMSGQQTVSGGKRPRHNPRSFAVSDIAAGTLAEGVTR